VTAETGLESAIVTSLGYAAGLLHAGWFDLSAQLA
jgi:hypothetical protein